MRFEPIGTIRTPFRRQAGTPIQPFAAEGAEGTVEVNPAWAEGLADLEGFERIWLLYAFDRAGEPRMRVTPYLDRTARGLFAVRAPCRPNPVGFSAVRLLGIEDCTLRVADVDMLDGTPLLDIKPYVPRFDSFPDSRAGWTDAASGGRTVADERFEPDAG